MRGNPFFFCEILFFSGENKMKDLTAYAIREREKNLLGDSSENSFDKALQDFIEPVLDKVLKDLEYAKFSRI